MRKNMLDVLVVEDDAIDYKSVERALSRFHEPGFALHHAESMEKGKRMLERQDFDAVILDLGLPNVDGLDSLIHFHANAPETPIVVLTGNGNMDTANDAVGMGAEDFLLKSDLYPERLEEKLRLAIRRNSAKLDLLRTATVMQQVVEMIDDAAPDARTAEAKTRALPELTALGCEVVLLESGEPIATRLRFVVQGPGSFIEERALPAAREAGKVAELALACARNALAWEEGLGSMPVHMDMEIDALNGFFVGALLESVPKAEDRKRLNFFLPAKIDDALGDRADRHIRTLKQAGFSFSLRDVGGGGSSLETLLSLEPAWLRLSPRLCNGVAEMKAKRKQLERWLRMLKHSGAPVLADQASPNDLHVLRELGIVGAVVGRYAKAPVF